MTLHIFEAGKGINATKINDNFSQVQTQSNTNEAAINNIADTALLKDGSNLEQSAINAFQQQTPNVLSGSGTISLADNTANFLTLTGNGTISLPAVPNDQYSHTIVVTVGGSNFSLNVGTTYHLVQNPYYSFDPANAYNILYIFNKLDKHWYYCITQ